ncbi:hypothetical protein PENSPDRAFT_647389 [Peniophora sp. CONT]|nr:hypothetical protein PENSPDRAFT_647389 [Peniophora sp. CONT]
MAKATFLQRILQRPSQTYYDPAPKRYHSVKSDLLQQASAVAGPSSVGASTSRGDTSITHDIVQERILAPNNEQEGASEDESDAFFTPLSTPTNSMHLDSRIIAAILPMDKLKHRPVLPPSASSSTSASTAPSTETDDSLFSRQSETTSTTATSTYTDEDWARDAKKHHRFSTVPSIPEYVDLPAREPKAKRRKSVRAATTRPATGKKDRMSALWEEDESGDQPPHLSRNNSAASTATARTAITRSSSTRTKPRRHTDPPSSSTSASRTASTATAATASTAGGSGVIGSLNQGYTSLSLPRAVYKPADPARTLTSGKVDLARDGRGQVTMASVEVVRGVASTSAFRTIGRRLSIRSSSSSSTSRHKSGVGGSTISAELALTSHRSPPTFVPSGCVLVQVHAVALEGLDLRLAREEGAGFVPGRAVVGRVVEAGVDVPREEGRRGEWVIGLADPKKCGALAEFILLDRHRAHRAPPPSVAGSGTLFPPAITPRSGSPTPFGPSTPHGARSRRSSASSSRSLAALPRGPSLSELALIPLAVSAWRAIRMWTPPSAESTETDLDVAFDDISELELPVALSRRLMMAGASTRGNASPRGSGSPYVASPLASTPSLASTSRGTSIRSPGLRIPRSGSTPCALVLQASSGAGALALVLLRAAHPHARLIAHIPPGALGLAPDTLPAPVCIDLRDWAALADAGLPLDARGADVLARLRGLGAAAAIVGDAKESLEAAAGAGEIGPAVDFVLDTVGGAGVWAAAAQLLGRGVGAERGESMFVTLVGSGESTRAVPGAQDHWRAARGPPKAFKTRRRVGWAWVPVSAEVDVEGLDVRAGIEAIMTVMGVGMSEEAVAAAGKLPKGQQHRWRALGDVLGGEEGEEVFERAMDAFGPRLEDGRCVVVKVAGA